MIKIKDVIGKFYVKNWRTGPCLSFKELNSLAMIGQQEQMQQAKCKKVKKKKRKKEKKEKRIVWQDVMSDSSVSSGTSELVFSQIFFELSQILFESKNMQIAKPFFLTLHKINLRSGIRHWNEHLTILDLSLSHTWSVGLTYHIGLI